MIPTQQYEEVISSSKGREVEASIMMTDQMFNILSSQIYTDKVLACIREPLCNGRDAQQETGSKEPILIHLPNQLEPFFYIRDYGTGISEESLMKLYLTYGYSTKTDSNDLIGGMGIGSKAPLAYADSFLVTSYYGGYKKTYNIFKDHGKPRVKLLSTKVSDEPTGLKVQIAAQRDDFSPFKAKTETLLKTFDYPVQVVGAEIDAAPLTPTVKGEGYSIYVGGYGQGGRVYARMGGICYNVSSSIAENLKRVLSHRRYMIIDFNIGELTVAASRESLSEDKFTTNALEKRCEEVLEGYRADIIKQVLTAKTPNEAYTLAQEQGLVRAVKPSSGTDGSGLIYTFVPEIKTLGGLCVDEVSRILGTTVRSISKCRDSTGTVKQAVLGEETFAVLVDGDKPKARLKVAKALSGKIGKKVLLVRDDHTLTSLQTWFGSINVEVFNATEQYDKLFPKGSTTAVTVKKSGVFTSGQREVKSLDIEDEGHYILFSHQECVSEGLNSLATEWDEWGRLAEILTRQGVLSKGQLYFVRKGGLPAIKKTKIVPLTKEVLIGKFREKYGHEEYRKFIKASTERHCKPLTCSTKLDNFIKVVAPYFPLLFSNAEECIALDELMRHLQIRELLTEFTGQNICGIIAHCCSKYDAEKEGFHKTFPLVNALPSYCLSSEVRDELIALAGYRLGINTNMKRNEYAK